MTREQIKMACRMFWQVKGHLPPMLNRIDTCREIYDDYFRRLWCNHEAWQWEEGFEQAWEKQKHKLGTE